MRLATFIFLFLFGAPSIAGAPLVAESLAPAVSHQPVSESQLAGDLPGAAAASGKPVATIPYKSNDFDLAGTVSETILYLGLLFAIAAVTIFLFKRHLVSSGVLPEKLGSHIRVVDRKSLSAKTIVHLLDIDGRNVLLSESQHGLSVVELRSGHKGASAGRELNPDQAT